MNQTSSSGSMWVCSDWDFAASEECEPRRTVSYKHTSLICSMLVCSDWDLLLVCSDWDFAASQEREPTHTVSYKHTSLICSMWSGLLGVDLDVL